MIPVALFLRKQPVAYLLAPIFALGTVAFLAYAVILVLPCVRALWQTFDRIYSVDGYVRYRADSDAYFAAVLSVEHGMSFWSVLPVAALVSGLAGAVLGAISLRLREDFFAITTVGLNFVVVALFKSVDFFGGATGIYGLPLPMIGGTAFTNDHFLVLSLTLLGLVVVVFSVGLAG